MLVAAFGIEHRADPEPAPAVARPFVETVQRGIVWRRCQQRQRSASKTQPEETGPKRDDGIHTPFRQRESANIRRKSPVPDLPGTQPKPMQRGRLRQSSRSPVPGPPKPVTPDRCMRNQQQVIGTSMSHPGASAAHPAEFFHGLMKTAPSGPWPATHCRRVAHLRRRRLCN
jgi:hypothetical protein